MSKRASDFQLSKDNPNGRTEMDNAAPVRATAAQLANRKIKTISRRRESPSPGPPSNAQALNFNPNPSTSFNFGATNPQETAQPAPFSFGAQATPAVSFPPTNGVASNNDMNPSKSFGGFGASGFGNGTSAMNGALDSGASSGASAFGNNSFQQNTGFAFGSSQPVSNPFAAISNPAPSSTNFSFGASSSAQPLSQPSYGFTFGATSSQPTETPKSPFGANGTNGTNPITSFAFGQSTQTNTQQSALPAFGSTNNSISKGPNTVATNDSANLFASKFAPSTSSVTTSSPFKDGGISNGEAPSSTPAPTFSFGASTSVATPSANVVSTKPTFSFGSTTPASSPSKPVMAESHNPPKSTFSFGSTTPAASPSKQFTADTSGTPKPTFSFGNNTQSSPALSSALNFGTSSSQEDKTITTEPSTANIFNFAKQATPSEPTPKASPTPTNQFTPPQFSAPTKTAPETAAIPPPVASGNLASSKYASPPSSHASGPPAATTTHSHPPQYNVLRAHVMDETIQQPINQPPADRPDYWHDVKVFRLNKQLSVYFHNKDPNSKEYVFSNFTPMFLQYIDLMKEIELERKTRLEKLGIFRANSSSPTPNNSVKRKNNDTNSQESSKKAKSDLGPTTPSKFAPQNSSDTAKKFDSFLNASPTKSNKSTTPEPSPAKSNSFENAGSTPFKSLANVTASAGSTPFKTTTDSQLNSSAGSSSFKPTFGATSSSPGSKPTTSATADKPSFGFKPTGAIGGTNFLAQFGAKSQKTAEEEKKKRKMEEFDSDEDDEEEWEKNYELQQEAKRRKFEEDRAKLVPPKFVFSSAAANGSESDPGMSRSVSPAGSVLDGPRPTGFNFFSHVSDTGSEAKDGDDSDEDDSSKNTKTNGTKSSSLFDRISPRDEAQPPAESTEDNAGDHTWKPSTPIKFSTPSANGGGFSYPAPAASAPPKATTGGSNNPFGTINPKVTFTPAANSSNTAGFSFGKANTLTAMPSTPSGLTTADTSRATTPLESEAGSNAGDAIGEEAPNGEPTKDLVNFAAATKGHDVLFECEKAKAFKYIKDVEKRKNSEQAWELQGAGPVAVLKNHDTNVVSILMKASPSGKVVVNTRLSPSIDYKVVGKRVRFQTLGEGQIDTWLVQVPNEELSKKMANSCEASKDGANQ